MDVKNCRNCGRLYNYIGGKYRLCPDCLNALEEKFREVREYIEAHKSASMKKISEDCEVSSKQIELWIREERLTFGEDSPVGIGCEKCGKTIKSGRYCDSCKMTMASRLGNAYGQTIAYIDPEKKAKKEAARMRFLENK